jgi:hypothetical protein
VKLIGRLLWLLLGLIYRLVMLVLFEKWIPFPEHASELPARPPRAIKQKQPKQRKADDIRAQVLAERARVAERVRDNRSGQAREKAFFEAQSSELSPEEAARREGEHWRNPHLPRAVARAAPRPRETLLGLLRDKRAIRDAVVLGSALASRRGKS